MALIDDHLGISKAISHSLEYISKLLDLHTKFTVEEISNWYSSCTERTKDVKVANKQALSINSVLLNSTGLLNIIDDTFLSTLLLECTEEINLSEEIELRIVNIINSTDLPLHRYILRYSNRLKLTKEVLRINNDCSYYMSQDTFHLLKAVSQKVKIESYKENLRKYINSQGIINDTIFIHALLLDISPRYISNVNYDRISTVVCYKHLSEYIAKSSLLQKYFRDVDDCKLKYPPEIDLNLNLNVPRCLTKVEVMYILLKNKKKLTKSEIQTIVAYDSAILLKFLIINNYNLDQMITRRILELEDAGIDFYNLIKRYGIEMVRKNIVPANQANRQLFSKYKILVRRLEGDLNVELQDGPELIGYISKYKPFLYENERLRLVEACMPYCSIEDLHTMLIDLDCPSRNISEFVVSNLSNIKNKTIATSLQERFVENKRALKAKERVNPSPKDFYKEIENHKHVLEILSTEVRSVGFVEGILDLIFVDYEFDFYSGYIPRIIKLYYNEGKAICRLIYKIQENVKYTLDTGFFKYEYFSSIRNILNTIIKYRINDNCSYCSKVRRNNDKIILGLAYYTKHFEKNLKVGTIKKI